MSTHVFDFMKCKFMILNAAYTAGQKQEGHVKWEVQAQF